MRKALVPAAIAAFVWAIAVWLADGIHIRVMGTTIRAHDASRPLIAGLVLLIGYAAFHRPRIISQTDRAGASLTKWASPIAIVISLLLGAHAVVFGTFSAGGADPYGYVSQAYGWARGELPQSIPVPLNLPFPSSDLVQTPLGYRLGQPPHTMVPTYAPGLPLLMAAGVLVAGVYGPFFVTPVCAALLVWFTFVLARHAAGPMAGVIAALVVSVTPVVLYQALWPMSDVPAGAFWTAALAASLAGLRRNALLAGVCTAIGLLIRPNVPPLVLVPLLSVALGAAGRERWIRSALFLLPIIPVPIAIAALNTLWYGSPVNSGYGSARDLYAAANVWPNVKLYASWFWESESPWAMVGVIALLPFTWRHIDRRVLMSCVLMMAVTLASYVAYTPFEVWWYLRFLLPAAGAAATIISIGIVTVARVPPVPIGRLFAAVILCMFVGSALSFAGSREVFGGLRAAERKYVDIGEFVARALPPNAAIFSGEHSGSLRYYGGRITLRFDAMDKNWAARAPAEIEHAGLHPYLMLDDFELPQFRMQFGLPPESRPPWPIVARMRELGGMTIWDFATVPIAGDPIALEPGSQHWCAAPKLALRVLP